MQTVPGTPLKLPAYSLDPANGVDWPPALVAGGFAGLPVKAADEPTLPVFCSATGWMRLVDTVRPAHRQSVDDPQGAYTFDVWTSAQKPWATAGHPVRQPKCLFGSHQICFGYDGSQLTMADEFDAAYAGVLDPGGWDAVSCFNFWPNRISPYPWTTGNEPWFRQTGTGVLNRVWWGTGMPFYSLGASGEPVLELTGLAFGKIAVVHPQFGFDTFPGYYTDRSTDDYHVRTVVDDPFTVPATRHGEWVFDTAAALPAARPGYSLFGTATRTTVLHDPDDPPNNYTGAGDQTINTLVGLYRHAAFVTATRAAIEAFKAAAPEFRALVVYGDPAVASITEPADGQHDPNTLALIQQVRTPEECVTDITGTVFEITRVPFEGTGNWATRASVVIQAWIAQLDS